MIKNLKITEFGDFQTPLKLAEKAARLIFEKYPYIKSILEPTCGIGNFIRASLKASNNLKSVYGWEINPEYIKTAKNIIYNDKKINMNLEQKDFFSVDWSLLPQDLTNSSLFIGNPPWVTNSELGRISSKNLPQKSNFQNHAGFEAITGKSNFDISEWMLIKIAEYISGKKAAMSFLVKTSVARKLFLHICKNKLLIKNIDIYKINTKKHFNVNVDACLLCSEGCTAPSKEYRASIYDSLSHQYPIKIMGYTKGNLVADIDTYNMLKNIDSQSEIPWRSGIKHDCSKVMEFNLKGDKLINGFQEQVDISKDYLYPMYKSSHIANDKFQDPVKYMLVTQKKIGMETDSIKILSPKTWTYLQSHKDKLDSRKSSIYKSAPKFSVFGVGDYSFNLWKIVISGLYKNIKFKLVGPFQEKPVVLDDTCYMMSFKSEEKAEFVYELLSSKVAGDFLDSIVFKDSKRPITVSILNRINLKQLALHLGLIEKYNFFFENGKQKQLNLF
ncbi:SAM-dependent methyltransferase domain-containing protein [Desulfonema limicola]|uniref:SAM-dependent methyltransferase domain-containing protein n=1 Tax=Desulfonema limicola TaxID=45656 RepID=A0A975BC19_9BACT|nr:SAM-dependent DNA methyltransferase [Desulfonema limicola]QTA82581.1 SAM-dependent methyltransferase domain-containing protein [Desulfonema limicola]